MFCTGIFLRTEYIEMVFLLAEYLVLKSPYGLNILNWNILRTEYFVLQSPYGLYVLYWNIRTD